MSADDALVAIDTAVMRLRRVWTTPRRRADLERDVGEGVPMSHVLVVDAVARATDQEVTVGVVGEKLSIDESTASRLVDATARAGLVDRGRSGQDSRRVVLTLTADGRRLVDRALQFRLGYLAELLGDWSDEDVATFAVLLRRFADAVNA